MIAESSLFADDQDSEFSPLVDQYENALHEGRDDTPEQWLLGQFSDDLRRQLADLHWLYRVTQPLHQDTLPESGSVDGTPTSALPGFEILGMLGSGGMGVVYKARQLRLNRLVALKVLLAGQHARPEHLDRFRSEALAVARLKHENIVTIHEVGEHDGQPYLVLEYVESGSLKERLDGTPQAARSAARLVEIVARAVHHAHEQSLIHRDLKPANILLVGREGPTAVVLKNGTQEEPFEPKVADFGLAKDLASSAHPTQLGEIVGTPSYMAPEQASGRTDTVGPGADVYALGAILYELLTGRAPFKAETTLETLQQVQHDEPIPPRSLVKKVPRELEIICLKCLHKTPGQRYLTALELAEDLQRFLEGRPIRARPTGLWERGVKWVKRNPALAVLIGAGISIVLMLLWSNWALGEAAQREHKLADEAKRQTKLASERLQNALDLLEPLSITVKGEDNTKVADRQFFLNQFSGLTRAFYKKLLSDQENPDPEVRRQLGRAFHGLGLSHAVLKESPAAEEAFRQAIALQEKLVNEFPAEAAYRVDLAVAYQSMGDEYLAQGNKEKASESYAKIVPLFEDLPHGLERLKLFALRLSEKLANLGKYKEAMAWANRLTEYFESLLKEETTPNKRAAIAIALANVYNLRAVLYMELGDPVEAEHDFERATQVKEAKDRPEVVKMYQQLRRQNWIALMVKKVMPAPAK